MLPNFLIAGSAKSGTTSLYYYLNQHPEISLPNLKEPKFFSSSNIDFPHNGPGDFSIDQAAIRSKEEYLNLFNDIKNKRVGEASPDYLFYYDKAIPEIKNLLGDIPIIIILRNPVHRAFSAYSYLKRDSREDLSFTEGLAQEENRLNKNFDFMWGYISVSKYHNQVNAYLDNFSNVKIIIFEEFINDINKGLKELYSFLNVDNSFKANIETKHNQSGIPSNILFKFLLSRRFQFSVLLRELVKKYIPRQVLENISNIAMKKIKISEDEKKIAYNLLQHDISNLELLLDKDLSIWKI